MGAFKILRQKFFRRVRPPCVGALFFHDFFHAFNRFGRNHIVTAVVAVESRNRNTPGALAGNTPVLAVTNHIIQAVMPPGRNEPCLIDRFQRIFTEIIDGRKPLLCRTINDRVLAAPAMGILVVKRLFAEKHAFMGKRGNTRPFRFPHCLSFQKRSGFRCHTTFIVHRTDDFLFQFSFIFIFLMHFKVVHTVPRGSMYAACTGIQCDMVAFKDIHRTIVGRPGMHKFSHFPFSTRHFTAGKLVVFNPAVRQSHRCQFFIHQVVLVGIRIMYPHIGEFRIDGNILVGRNGPRRGCPDDSKELGLIYALRSESFDIFRGELHINGRGLAVLILNFRFRQRRFTVGTPVNSFLSFVDISLSCHFAKNFYFLGFQMRIKSNVTVIKIADNAHADKIGFLDFNPLFRVFQAFAAQFKNGHIRPIFSRIFQYGILNRKTVGIPAGDIVCHVPRHIFVADDNILQCFIQGVANVDLAVCIRRSVMKHEAGRAFLLSFLYSLIV